MKRVLSFVIAVVAAMSLSIPAFADVGFDDTNYQSNALYSTNTVTTAATTTSTSLGISTSVSVELNQIIIVDSKTKQVIAPETRLLPGEEFTFNLYRVTSIPAAEAGTIYAAPIKKGELDGAKLRARAVKGSSVMATVKIEEKGSSTNATYNLKFDTRENYGTKTTDVEYRLEVTGATANTVDLVDGYVFFKVGYGKFTDEEIDEFTEGDIITITDDKSIITRKQFETLAKEYNYKAIEFESEDGDWMFTGRVSGMGDSNFIYTYDLIPSLVNKYPDQDFKTLVFNAGVTFPTNGEMRIDVSDISSDYSRMYLYLYRDGKLTPVNATYDSGADQIVFRTNYLGAFVITNEEITDTSVLEPEETPKPSDTGTSPTPGTPTNPNTGAAPANMAAAIGLMALASSTLIIRKKK